MRKNSKRFMDLKRETAMRLWNKAFGKETKTQDFAGRTIAKGAYNDRNSEFGWNLDHILPQSKGGVTADHNLVCCHIQTNDEKANKFPCFNANGIAFEIIKVQNHYEIHPKNNELKKQKEIPKTVDFFDSASGVRYFKKLKGMQNKCRFVGSVLIRLQNVSNNAVVDFIEELFESENISFSKSSYLFSNEIQIKISNYDMPLKDDSNALLDKCILLNTYLSAYFLECNYIGKFDIYYREDCFKDKTEMYSGNIDFGNAYSASLHNSMFVNDLVLENTEAGDKVKSASSSEYNCVSINSLYLRSEYTEYNYVFTNLSKNLKKEANGK